MDAIDEVALAVFNLNDENNIDISFEDCEDIDIINDNLLSIKEYEGIQNEFIANSSQCSNIFGLKDENKSVLIPKDNLDNKNQDIYLLTNDNKSFLCKLCEIKILKKDLEKHLIFHKNSQINNNYGIRILCLKCNKKFININEFDLHFLIHKLYQCNYCMKKFAQRTSLNFHKRIHTDEKPFTCQICDKKFRLKTYLNAHSVTHYGQRPFKCKFCMKTFTQRSSLVNHLLIHTGVKRYECELCNKRFSLKSYLNTHLKGHLNQIEIFDENV